VTYLTPQALAADLALRDLTDPAQGPHAIQLIVDPVLAAVTSRWDADLVVDRGERTVDVADNYDRLGYTADATTRDARYTRYVDAGRLLRSQTSALVPPALRRIAAAGRTEVVLACPGMVYRRDAIDRLHTGTPHQLDLWRITSRPVTEADLDEMIAVLLGALVPGLPYRQEPRVHPYTERGRQVDVWHDGRWVEVWECGLAHPGVLAAAGLAGCGGLALGMGLDRMLMLVKGIGDIRLFRSADPRIVRGGGPRAVRHAVRRPAGRRGPPPRGAAGPAEPPRPRRAPGPGADADQRGRERAARPHLPGHSSGQGAPVGSGGQAGGNVGGVRMIISP
jgi:phenylalanyl-tRNA synthetase alpha chain